MPVDASIPLQVQPLKVPDPLQGYGRLVSIQNAQAQNRLADLQGQAAQGALDENAAYKAVFSDPANFDAKGNLTPDAVTKLYAASPSKALSYNKTQLDNRVAQSNILKNTSSAAKTTQDMQFALQRAHLQDTYNGLLQAQKGDLNGALQTFNQNLPAEQRATRLEMLPDGTLRSYLQDGSTHDTNITQMLPVLRQQLIKPDTAFQVEHQDARANATLFETKRHNQAEEGIGQTGNSIKQQELNKPNIALVPQQDGTTVAIDKNTVQSGSVVGGKQQQPKPIPTPQAKELDNLGDRAAQINRIATNFQPQFAGHSVLGGAVTTYGKIMGDDTGQTQFWQDYYDYIAQVRHDRLGGVLTPQELQTFNKYAIDERTDPKQAQQNIQRQQEIVNGALQRRANAAAAAGYNPDEIKLRTGFTPTVSASTGSQSRIVNFNGKNMTAKRAPDGNFYVQMGDKFYRVDH